MQQFWKRTLAAILTLGLAVSLSACGGGLSSFDATKYVKGILDENYLGQYDDDFLEMVNATESEAEEIYLSNLEQEANYFASVFEIEDMSGDTLDTTMELYRKIYSMSKFTVDPATKVDDSTFSVKVTVEPIDIFHLVAEELNSDNPTSPAVKAFHETYLQQDIQSMTQDEYDQFMAKYEADFENDWTAMVLALVQEKLDDPGVGYLDTQTLMVQVAKDSDGVWGIPDNDFQNLDWLIIDYNF